MKIELKNIKVNLAFSEETTMFRADLFIDGIKVAIASNDGHGGSTDYSAYDKGKRELLEKAEAYCKTLPQRESDFGHSYDMCLEYFIDDLLYADIQKKEVKAFEKKMLKQIMFGVPNSDSYHYASFKKPLSEIPIAYLQKFIDDKKKDFKKGEVFLNTNLETLGLKI